MARASRRAASTVLSTFGLFSHEDIDTTLDAARDNVGMRDRLLKVLQKVTTEPLNIGDDDSLFESGLLDSFALPDLVSGLEEEFSFKVPDADLHPRKFDSIARIEAYLSEHAKV